MSDSQSSYTGSLERGEIDGKSGWVVWLDDLGWPTSKEQAGQMKINFDGGGSMSLQLSQLGRGQAPGSR